VRSEAGLVEHLSAHFHELKPDLIGVAVSGGSDSLALLYAAVAWGGPAVEAVTVDHGLRPEAAGEARHVADLCEGLGVPHHVLCWDGWDGKGNLQDHARKNRYSLIADLARDRGLDAVALGHTMDDQAETFLMRLSRRAGVDGLGTMASSFDRYGVRFDRPFLMERRADLRAYLEAQGVKWVDDPSNEDEGFDRVKARKALETLGIDAVVLFDVSQNMRAASNALGHFAWQFALDHARVVEGDVIFDRARLNRLPPELHRRLLAGALKWVASAEYPPRRDALIDVEAACYLPKNATLHGCRILVSDMTVRVVREHAAVASLRCATDQIWDNRWLLEGPNGPDLEIRALGDAVMSCPDWRDTGMPRASLLASPAVFRGETLVAAPVAGLTEGWTAKTRDLADFGSALIAH
jgi:tRNA(Ile)-lysidine synthase